MKKLMTLTSAVMVAFSCAAFADEDAELVIDGTEFVTKTKAPDYIEGLDEIMSGWRFRTDETQEMQADDFTNPAILDVDTARDVWATAEGSNGKSCADCHGEPEKMAGVYTTFPKWHDASEKVITMTDQINLCRENQMGAEPYKYDSADSNRMNALMAYVSRGMPMNVKVDGPAESAWKQGEEIYYTRYGQLELSCANCHEDHYGDNIRADHLSQGQINGFPTYRLKQAKLISVHNRFVGCIRDTRAEPFKVGSDEFRALELYVASRGNGLSVEGPAVRN